MALRTSPKNVKSNIIKCLSYPHRISIGFQIKLSKSHSIVPIKKRSFIGDFMMLKSFLKLEFLVFKS